MYAILEHQHHQDHLIEFFSKWKKITLKNFFTISSANELYACEDNSERIEKYESRIDKSTAEYVEGHWRAQEEKMAQDVATGGGVAPAKLSLEAAISEHYNATHQKLKLVDVVSKLFRVVLM